MTGELHALAIATGAYGNIGDALIRSEALEWLDGAHHLAVYVGRADDQWIDRLGRDAGRSFYAVERRWEWIRLCFGGPAPSVLLFDPGAVPLGKGDLIPESINALLTAVVRIRGGAVIRPPRGVGEASRLTLMVHRLSCRMSHIVLWRDSRSLELVRIGELAPDTAFGVQSVVGLPPGERKLLLISMRGRRVMPSREWFLGVRTVRDALGLEPVTISQVREDEERNRAIAEELGCRHVGWSEAGDQAQEAMLRGAYEECRLVVTDRLHVAILAALHGATPLEYVPEPTSKLTDAFASIGYEHRALSSLATPLDEVVAHALGLVSSRELLLGALTEAHDGIAAIRSRIRHLVGFSSTQHDDERTT